MAVPGGVGLEGRFRKDRAVGGPQISLKIASTNRTSATKPPTKEIVRSPGTPSV
jgi:hypothetical protein